MSGKGIFFGALIGLLITQRVWGAAIGAVIGFLLYESTGFGRGAGGARGTHSISISDEFFRTTFELMGHVAKSDGRVSEAEIDAARRLMQELRLGPREISIAIECFRNGKSADYDAEEGNWYLDVTASYATGGTTLRDRYSGSISWTEDTNRKTNGKG